jgi:AcrR family transcriptional regulator
MTDQINDFGHFDQPLPLTGVDRKRRDEDKELRIGPGGIQTVPSDNPTDIPETPDLPNPSDAPAAPKREPSTARETSEPAAGSLRARKKAAARTAILNTARRLIRARGYDHTRMRDIAAAAGVSYQTLYNYFPGKGHVLAALLDEQLVALRAGQRQALEDYEGNLLISLTALQRLLFEMVAGEDRPLWRVVLLERLDSPSVQEPAGLLDDFTLENLSQLIGFARSAGELAPAVIPTDLARTLFDLTEMRALRFLLDPGAGLDAALEGLGVRTRLVVSPYLS